MATGLSALSPWLFIVGILVSGGVVVYGTGRDDDGYILSGFALLIVSGFGYLLT